MSDLDTLRPEVRDALFSVGKRCDAETFDTLSAELLRLTRNDADARIALDADHDWKEMYERAKKAEAELAALQARIDALMLEFCPEDMTEEQVAAWSARQRVVDEPQDDNAKEGRSRE